MRKIAFFVEGYTEVLFVTELIKEIAGANNVVVNQIKITGGTTVPKSYRNINISRPVTNEQFYVLIYDCGSDNAVAQRIREEHENLSNDGYTKIVGVRDVYPDFPRAEIPRLERGLRMYIRTSLIPVDFILGVMEVEAWFLAEFSHFSKVDAALTPVAIHTSLGIDLVNDDLSQRNEPAKDMDQIYALAGKSYVKGAPALTSNHLDFAYIYANTHPHFPDLNRLITHIDQFLS